MKNKKIPMRRCIASNEMKPKKEMIRIVKSKDGTLNIDPTGKMNGRGAYISLEPALVQDAWKKHLLNRQFEMDVSDDFYKELFEYVEHQKARSLL
ncbi:YlxR family protein [Jeotgalibaca sp. MA1X17-3]|uniref:RNase P modulator RnpM n=1 Tax=Jeotgalibaca sp. MA1X17-3 TaxID=2908211 RepID=UPI001F36E5D1|nr:YlxR family protein [Jeotgalibaca sp. MA1X17-3]UJF14742.1 YlxR family protein [Jeotgalibaca sp. MA1X17-3]